MIHRRTLIGLLAIGCITAMGYGLILKEENPIAGNSYIGFGTLILFLVAMPIFIFTESKGKKIKDYMLTTENIKKMQGKSEKPKKREHKAKKTIENS